MPTKEVLHLKISAKTDFNSQTSIVKLALFSLKEFRITDTELKLIAAAAIMGLSRIPKKG